MRIFVFYEYMQDNTENRQNVASYIEKRKNNNNEKEGIFMISYKKTDRQYCKYYEWTDRYYK